MLGNSRMRSFGCCGTRPDPYRTILADTLQEIPMRLQESRQVLRELPRFRQWTRATRTRMDYGPIALADSLKQSTLQGLARIAENAPAPLRLQS